MKSAFTIPREINANFLPIKSSKAVSFDCIFSCF